MLNNPNGLLQDPPGLGKTLQVIYLAEELKAQENYEHCLILCGINSLKNNWKKEILTIPNLLSFFRLVLIPFYMAIYLKAEEKLIEHN